MKNIVTAEAAVMIWSSNIISEEQKEVYDENEKVAELFCGDLYVVRFLSGGMCGDRDRGRRGRCDACALFFYRRNCHKITFIF